MSDGALESTTEGDEGNIIGGHNGMNSPVQSFIHSFQIQRVCRGWEDFINLCGAHNNMAMKW